MLRFITASPTVFDPRGPFDPSWKKELTIKVSVCVLARLCALDVIVRSKKYLSFACDEM